MCHVAELEDTVSSSIPSQFYRRQTTSSRPPNGSIMHSFVDTSLQRGQPWCLDCVCGRFPTSKWHQAQHLPCHLSFLHFKTQAAEQTALAKSTLTVSNALETVIKYAEALFNFHLDLRIWGVLFLFSKEDALPLMLRLSQDMFGSSSRVPVMGRDKLWIHNHLRVL